MAVFANFIDGEWVEVANATPNINPSDTDDVIGEYAAASLQQVADAAAAARAAFPAWSRTTAQARGDILNAAADEMLARKGELGELLSREEGKTLPEGIGEVIRASQIVRFFAGEALRLRGERLPPVRPGVEIEITREPLGVIGVITPWNFPIAIAAWKIAPALAFGNCVLFKPAELTPALGWALVDIFARAGLPKGVLNLLMGKGAAVGPAIIEAVDAISFTGSVPTGRGIAAKAIETMTRIQLEMGGKNPLIVLDDADLDLAVETAVSGSFIQTGQRCTASSRLIVTDGVADQFIAAVTERMSKMVVDHALKAITQIGPVVDQRQLDSNLHYLEIGDGEGAKRAGGDLLKRDTSGFYMAPALFTNTHKDMRINREEIFGPIATVIRAKNYDEALELANDTEFGLSAGICTTSLKYARDFQRNSQAGLTMVNLPTAGLDYHVPFGGRKGSSYGVREQGSYAAEFYTIVKTSYVNA
jgi:acyl-CoA reductase-like NAD-dependent aldehyde dehydrogenase